MNPIRLAGCILFDEKNNLLLIHRNKNGKIQWETPGGKVEKDESDEDAAMRELQEELGVPVRLFQKIGEGDFLEKEKLYHCVWYRAELASKESIIQLETGFDEYRYFPLDEIQTMKNLLSPGTKKLLELHFDS